MNLIESEVMELKSKYTDTICKDIVAFLNADGGDIVIGVNDDGSAIGITSIDETSRKISDIITDQIEPNPQSIITTEIQYYEKKMVFVIHVNKGVRPLYCQKKYGFSTTGCVIRIGTTCKNMTSEEIKIRYEKNYIESDLMTVTSAKYASISFHTLKVYYAEKGYHLDDSSFEMNLNLRNQNGEYNLLAELLSDKNMIPLIVAKFDGKDKSSVSQRNDYGNQCLLFSYQQIMNRINAENICAVDTTIRPRQDHYLFDIDAVNEAIINALVHNDWNISEPLISLFEDRIEIFSHGGLPKGQTKELFFKGISKPRNNMLMRIFLNMNLSEHTGHGIPTILSKYGESVFDIGESYINVTIPYDKKVLKKINQPKQNNQFILTNTEKKILSILLEDPSTNMEKISILVGVSKRTIERSMKKLQENNYLMRQGSKKTGTWLVIK